MEHASVKEMHLEVGKDEKDTHHTCTTRVRTRSFSFVVVSTHGGTTNVTIIPSLLY
jgi:hypothetical protein